MANHGDRLLPSEETLEAVLLKRQTMEQARTPDIRIGDRSVLKNGPKTFKVAIHWVITDRHTGEFHHHAVTLESYQKQKSGWYQHPSNTITVSDEDTDELGRLVTFLDSIRHNLVPEERGEYLIIPVTGGELSDRSIQDLLRTIVDRDKARLIADALESVAGDPELLQALVQRAMNDDTLSREVAALLNLSHFTADVSELNSLIERNAPEREFQRHLEANPWMFGSEYSELLSRRTWTRGQQQDFMCRRTTDGYLEVIEIKTPLRGESLFRYDDSHSTYYPRPELSAAIGQVINYLSEFDASRDTIAHKDGEHIDKIRAKVIIGRDGTDAQKLALRQLNGHLHRIEVITFDQLIRTANHVISYLEHSTTL